MRFVVFIFAVSMQMKFILAVIAGEVVVSNRKRAAIEADLERMGFDRMPKSDTASKRGVAVAAEPADGDGEDAAAEAAAAGESYDYLLSMPIASLTLEKVPVAASALPASKVYYCSC